jgi:hypothetical protein
MGSALLAPCGASGAEKKDRGDQEENYRSVELIQLQ